MKVLLTHGEQLTPAMTQSRQTRMWSSPMYNARIPRKDMPVAPECWAIAAQNVKDEVMDVEAQPDNGRSSYVKLQGEE